MGVDARMFVRSRSAYSADEVLALAVRLVKAFGTDILFVSRPCGDGDEYHHHAIEKIDRWEQDGPDIEPCAGEHFYEVHLWGRYYGPGYERGHIHDYIAVAEWLERNMQGVVWYGGDSSGICAEPFDAPSRRRFFDHFARVGHSPYVEYDSPYMNRTKGAPTCNYCKVAMVRYGWGGKDDWRAYQCHGCGLRLEARGDEDLHEPKPACEHCDRPFEQRGQR